MSLDSVPTASDANGNLYALLGSKPAVRFSVGLDANSFFQSFVKPIVTGKTAAGNDVEGFGIRPMFRSIDSLVSILNYKIPYIDFAISDLIDYSLQVGVFSNFGAFFDALHKLSILEFPTLPAGTFVNLGSFNIAEDARAKNHGPNGEDYVDITAGDVVAPATTPLQQMYDLVNSADKLVPDINNDFSISADSKNLQNQIPGEFTFEIDSSHEPVKKNFFDVVTYTFTYGVEGLDVPIPIGTTTYKLLEFPMLESPISSFKMLLGQQAELLTWDVPPLNLALTVPLAPFFVGPVLLSLVPQFFFQAHFNGGYDTHGFEVFDASQGYYLSSKLPSTIRRRRSARLQISLRRRGRSTAAS